MIRHELSEEYVSLARHLIAAGELVEGLDAALKALWLEPGLHAFGATGADWRFQGRWHIRGGPLRITVRSGALDARGHLRRSAAAIG